MFTLLLEVIFMIPTHIIVSHFLWLEWMAELIFLPFAIERKTRQSFISRPSLQTIRWREKPWNGCNMTDTTNESLKPSKIKDNISILLFISQVKLKNPPSWFVLSGWGLSMNGFEKDPRAKPKHDLWFIRVSLVSNKYSTPILELCWSSS